MQIVDLHCDTLSKLRSLKSQNNIIKYRYNDNHVNLTKLRIGGYMLQFFAAFVDMAEENNPTMAVLEQIDIFNDMINNNNDIIAKATSYRDVINNIENKKISAILSVEEGGTCVGNIEILHEFYNLGVRMMTLTWNYENELAFPNIVSKKENGTFISRPNKFLGLKELGLEFIKEMQKIGMIIDVSHLSDAGFYDVLNNTTKPFVASHSNARSLSPHVRNLTDDMIVSLANRGGVIGINYNAAFLDKYYNEKMCKSTVSLVADHIDYIFNLGGVEVVALGSDFDGISCELEIKDCSYLPMLETELQKRGYSRDNIEKIFNKNVLRVLKDLL